MISTYWFLADVHSIDRLMLLGVPDPAGASDRDGVIGLAAWWFTALGKPEVIFVIALALFVGLLAAKRWAAALFLTVAVAGGAIAGYVTKAIFGLLRPHHLPGSTELIYTSFPSGHALLATLIFGAIALLTVRSTASAVPKMLVSAVVASLAIFAGLSRVYLGMHWPSDVLAGWAAGILWLMASDQFCRKFFTPKIDTST